MNNLFYQMEARTPGGKPFPFKDLQGKVVLIVNTATKCGLAPQFEGLETLYQQYKDQGLVVLGFPCNQFAGQEPETNATVEQVCKINHGVTFLLTEKCDVNGKNTHPVFKYLKSRLGGLFGSRIKWNFTKFLVDREGNPYRRYAPTTAPAALEKDIVTLLKMK
ncbi:MAG: glutathione peroxidase [Sphingobacteriales bacterium]|nr:glutathione peroxidase [Sphingobacteriales bacterium]OJY80818.1 MAG: glutathione peroxidase [Sphingobacteriales bacterium 44-15]